MIEGKLYPIAKIGVFLYGYALITLFPYGVSGYITLDEYTLRESPSGHRKGHFPAGTLISFLSSAIKTQAVLPLLQPD